MTGIDWVLLIGRVIVVFVALLLSVLLYIWMERKVIADFQTRTGPMRAGPARRPGHVRRRSEVVLQGVDPPL
jgi:NADH:ubiquinone oxidoreductase subunit H